MHRGGLHATVGTIGDGPSDLPGGACSPQIGEVLCRPGGCRLPFVSGYMILQRAGELRARAEEAASMLADCRLCARNCGVDRLTGGTGVCRGGRLARVACAFPHHGEEEMIRGQFGSGTIFLGGCPLHCIFCQNPDISHHDGGREMEPEHLASTMEHLVSGGCHNLNFVTPSHYLPQLLEALTHFAQREPARTPPLVWNCGGYESRDGLRLLDGVVDIYMPDFKFLDAAASRRYLGAADYPGVVTAALDEMYRQVGPVQFDRHGILQRGVLIRHLVMPGLLADTRRIIDHIARRFSTRVALNVMGQYRPCYEAARFPELNRALDRDAWLDVLAYAKAKALMLA